MSTRKRWTVCGIVIGSASSYDQLDPLEVMLMDFKPSAHAAKLPHGDITINFETGIVSSYDHHGAVDKSVRLFDALQQDESV